uniref:Uncharacterized protein n=1 Tax=Anguilla anguilla TaxID=7936 RepID=A0A0E9X515_ANGAN
MLCLRKIEKAIYFKKDYITTTMHLTAIDIYFLFQLCSQCNHSYSLLCVNV